MKEKITKIKEKEEFFFERKKRVAKQETKVAMIRMVLSNWRRKICRLTRNLSDYSLSKQVGFGNYRLLTLNTFFVLSLFGRHHIACSSTLEERILQSVSNKFCLDDLLVYYLYF